MQRCPMSHQTSLDSFKVYLQETGFFSHPTRHGTTQHCKMPSDSQELLTQGMLCQMAKNLKSFHFLPSDAARLG
jgi:hypothetical protein